MDALIALNTMPTTFGRARSLDDGLAPCRFVSLEELRAHFRSLGSYPAHDLAHPDLRLALAWIGYWGAAEFAGTLDQAVRWMADRRPPLARPPHYERICVYHEDVPESVPAAPQYQGPQSDRAVQAAAGCGSGSRPPQWKRIGVL